MTHMNLTQQFLIAMPAMADSRFAKSLILICEHNDNGALGIVVNRPIDLSLQDLFIQLKITSQLDHFQHTPVLYGGPVQADRGFVLHQLGDTWQSTLVVSEGVGLTTSKDILEAIAKGEGPERYIVSLGYAGWAPGQLEHELGQNAWLTVDADYSILFTHSAAERLSAATQSLGIDYATLSDTAGHA